MHFYNKKTNTVTAFNWFYFSRVACSMYYAFVVDSVANQHSFFADPEPKTSMRIRIHALTELHNFVLIILRNFLGNTGNQNIREIFVFFCEMSDVIHWKTYYCGVVKKMSYDNSYFVSMLLNFRKIWLNLAYKMKITSYQW